MINDYLNLRVGAKARLHALRARAKALADTRTGQPVTWRDVRYAGFNTMHRGCGLLSQGANGAEAIHYSMVECSIGRERYADEVRPRAIRHKGWYTDPDGHEVMRGFVTRLTRGRGFIAGTVIEDGFGERGMGSKVFHTSVVYDDEDDAATAADEIARVQAGDEMEYQIRYEQARELERQAEDTEQSLCEALALRNIPRFEYMREQAREYVETLREARERLRTDYAGLL